MSDVKPVPVGAVTLANDRPFVLIAGPCQMESRDHALMLAGRLAEITQELGIPFVFKTSFDKANRTSLKGQRGLGLEAALPVFQEIRAEIGCPILTDIHEREQIDLVAPVVDILQIPAFLCRQTDLLLAAGESGCAVNVKKGQFLAPWDMPNVAAKVAATGNEKIILTERGASFGYNTLISDFRGLPIMAATGYPVVFDATHSVQQPGGLGGASGGQREFVPVLARAAVAVGVAGIFMECHDDPDQAPSDGPNMVPLDDVAPLLALLRDLDRLAKSHPVRLDS